MSSLEVGAESRGLMVGKKRIGEISGRKEWNRKALSTKCNDLSTMATHQNVQQDQEKPAVPI